MIEEPLKQLVFSALTEAVKIRFKGYQLMMQIRKTNISQKMANFKKTDKDK